MSRARHKISKKESNDELYLCVSHATSLRVGTNVCYDVVNNDVLYNCFVQKKKKKILLFFIVFFFLIIIIVCCRCLHYVNVVVRGEEEEGGGMRCRKNNSYYYVSSLVDRYVVNSLHTL